MAFFNRKNPKDVEAIRQVLESLRAARLPDR
jgi:hypothetical protein